ncbi:hypothetical protein FU659_32330 [Paenibacillus sp. N3.4]|nr:hypothetical protein FU659_32330 [Paenibacillus sp. N3.4]
MFVGYLFLGGLLWLIFFSGGKKKELPSSPALINLHESNNDLERFIEYLEGGWSAISEIKGKWPVFGTALFVFIRNENYHSKRSRLSIDEFVGKSAFDKDALHDLAKAAASKGLLKFDGDAVDLRDTPTLDELLKKLFR